MTQEEVRTLARSGIGSRPEEMQLYPEKCMPQSAVPVLRLFRSEQACSNTEYLETSIWIFRSQLGCAREIPGLIF